jgi:ribosomal protein S18 acetylase RimI-like enzyme
MNHRVKRLSNIKQVRELVTLHNQMWNSSPGIIDLLKNASDCFLLLNQENRVIGYAFVEEDPQRGFVELQDIVVSTAYQHQGGGEALMKAIMAKYPFIKLIARALNESLVNFYRNLDFQVEYLIENYYEISQDGLRMSWRSPSPGDE